MSIKRSVTLSRIFAAIGVDRVKSAVTFARLKAEAVIGFFITVFATSDTANAAESHSKAVGKVLSDSGSVSETDAKTVTKANSEAPSVSESHVVDLSKSLLETPSISESHVISIAQGLSDGLTVSENQVVLLNKVLTDSVGATDDVDGQASVEDDQEIQFFKVASNVANIAESHVKLTSKVAANTAESSDSGSILAQNYTVDMTYFAEDYVGQSSTF